MNAEKKLILRASASEVSVVCVLLKTTSKITQTTQTNAEKILILRASASEVSVVCVPLRTAHWRTQTTQKAQMNAEETTDFHR